jgi:hypothetical protein
MARQGSFPIVAPVKPYTEFALIYKMVNRAQEKGSGQSGSIRWTYLQGKLATIQHSALERVGFLLQVGLRTFTRTDQIFEYGGKKAFPPGRLHEPVFESALKPC